VQLRHVEPVQRITHENWRNTLIFVG
jgi:hypothetical protein